MSYMIEKFEAGDVKFQGDAAGWLMDDGEFRPLMEDAMRELYEGDYMTAEQVIATLTARKDYTEKMLAEYCESQANRSDDEIAETTAEMRAAYGPGQRIVNHFTGEITLT